MNAAIGYVVEVLLGLDQLANTLLGGYADESISARSWRLRTKSLFWQAMRIVVDTLFFFQANHCQHAYESEQLRLQEPPEYRK